MTDPPVERPEEPIPVSPQARRMARRLARLVDRATRNLPFGAEPASYLVARDRLAEGGSDGSR